MPNIFKKLWNFIEGAVAIGVVVQSKTTKEGREESPKKKEEKDK